MLGVAIATASSFGAADGGAGAGTGTSGPPCSVQPTLQYAPYSNGIDFPIQVVGTCAGIIGNPLYYIRLTVAGSDKKIYGVDSHSNPKLPPDGSPAPGCSSLPATSITCNVEPNEPDGGICTHITASDGSGSDDFAPGDQIRIELLDENMKLIPTSVVSYATQTLTVPTAKSKPCHL